MSEVNQGEQFISWKYKTPLVAQELSKTLGHFSSEGLCDIDVDLSEEGVLKINKCSMLVKPTTYIGTPSATNKDPVVEKSKRDEFLFKVTTSDIVKIKGLGENPLNTNELILTYSYSFSSGNTPTERWYGSFQLHTPSMFKSRFLGTSDNYEDIIIGILYRQNSSGSYSFTTNGADWSDVALFEKGYDPNCWISMQSPRRAFDGDTFSFGKYLEIRKHNELKDDFVKSTMNKTINLTDMISDGDNFFSLDGTGLSKGTSEYSIATVCVKKPTPYTNGLFASLIIEPRTVAPTSPFGGITGIQLVKSADWSSLEKDPNVMYIVK